MFRVYGLSGSYFSWLHFYVSGGYVWSLSNVFLRHPLICFRFFSNDMCLVPAYLLLSFANLLSTQNYFLFDDSDRIVRSISSATDSTVLQSDIFSIVRRCAADFMKRNIDKTEVRISMLITCCLKQIVGAQLYFEPLFCYWWFRIVILLPS
jgi:hypothetical protein